MALNIGKVVIGSAVAIGAWMLFGSAKAAPPTPQPPTPPPPTPPPVTPPKPTGPAWTPAPEYRHWDVNGVPWLITNNTKYSWLGQLAISPPDEYYQAKARPQTAGTREEVLSRINYIGNEIQALRAEYGPKPL